MVMMIIKKYNNFLNEGLMLDLFDFLHKFNNPVIAEDELRKKVIGKTVVWYPVGGGSTLKRQTVGDIRIEDHKVYFNGYPVDQDFSIEIETTKQSTSSALPTKKTQGSWKQPKTWEIIGIPSGEVIYVDTKELNILITKDLVKYQSYAKYRDVEYREIYIYRDEKYHDIKKFLNPNYKKPEKSNYKEKTKYHIGDVILCQGQSAHSQGYVLNLDMRVGKIIDMYKGPKETEYRYLISFMNNFDPHLVNIGGNINKFCWWVKKENIKGIYTGDLKFLKTISDVMNLLQKEDYIEEHEIDDAYHIKQLFKGTDGAVTYESVSIENTKTIKVKDIIEGKYGEFKAFDDGTTGIEFKCNYADLYKNNQIWIGKYDCNILRFESKNSQWYNERNYVGTIILINKYDTGRSYMPFAVRIDDYAIIGVPKEKKQIFSLHDPYGEEEWDND